MPAARVLQPLPSFEMPRRLTPLALALVIGLAFPASPAAAQHAPADLGRPRYAVGVVAGASQFDLSGTGTAGLLGARVEAELRRWLVAEGAVGFFRPGEQFGGRASYAIPEAQLQVQFPGRVVRPYLGAGGGYVFASGGGDAEGTASGAGGLRVALPGAGLDARGELRVRGIGQSFAGSTAEWTLGVGYRF